MDAAIMRRGGNSSVDMTGGELSGKQRYVVKDAY
jgi:hypothetical protein